MTLHSIENERNHYLTVAIAVFIVSLGLLFPISLGLAIIGMSKKDKVRCRFCGTLWKG